MKYGVVIPLALAVRMLAAQDTQSPQELLKQAVVLQQQGKNDAAIHDYELFLDMYPDVPE